MKFDIIDKCNTIPYTTSYEPYVFTDPTVYMILLSVNIFRTDNFFNEHRYLKYLWYQINEISFGWNRDFNVV